MVLIDCSDWTHFKPERPEHKAGDQIGQDQRLAREMGGDAEQPCHDDGQREVVDQFVHRASSIGDRLSTALAKAIMRDRRDSGACHRCD